jgi:pyruvate ferredoxin oxidoreductase alpha subunit
MVCMDGFVLTHAVEPIDVPSQEDVDAYLPAFVPRQLLDPDDPITIGAMVGPEAFAEVRYLMHAKQMDALDALPELAAEFSQQFGRSSGGLLRRYRTDDAETIVLGLGSILGTIEDTVDELRGEGMKIGAVGLKCFRPFPAEEVVETLAGARRIIVFERAFSVGAGAIVGQNVRAAFPASPPPVFDVVAGLGGRPVTRRSVRSLIEDVLAGLADPARITFLDVKWDVVEQELARMKAGTRSGPHAENILRDVGIVAARLH